jgi:Phytanoyl-CoA dioxygenase (PhyH)
MPAQVDQISIASGEDTGSLGVIHLKRLWSRCMMQRTGAPPPDGAEQEWAADNTVIWGLGLGLHETLRYLYATGPSFEQFESWILERNQGAIDPARIERINAALAGRSVEMDAAAEDSLTAEDLQFWEGNGYVVIHNAVSPEGCAAAVEAICEFLRMDLNDPDTWYNGPQGHSIWVPLLRHPAIEANRHSPRVRRAFEQIWQRTDLWMTVDQSGMNPPQRPGWRFPGPHLHWDVSLALPIPFGTQGLLYLTDTEAEQGAFTCVPGFHKTIESWLHSLPEGTNPRQLDLEALGAKAIDGKAGDLIIWHQALPHGSRPNNTSKPRFVQYMNMRPADFQQNPEWR